MSSSKTTADKIVDNALSPKRASNETSSAEQHPIADQIAADDYARKVRAARRGFGIFKNVKLVPPSAID